MFIHGLFSLALFLFNCSSVHDGDYYRLLTPGEYEVFVSHEGYSPEKHYVTVTEHPHEEAQRVDFALRPLPPVRMR